MSDKSNATFLTFKESGKYYTSHRGFLSEDVFKIVTSRREQLEFILHENRGRFPGLSGDGYEFHRIVFLDEDVDYGFPLMFPAGL